MISGAGAIHSANTVGLGAGNPILSIEDSVISDNYSRNGAGAVSLDRTGILNLTNSLIANNASDIAGEVAGGIQLVDVSSATITNSQFIGNKSLRGSGGGLSVKQNGGFNSIQATITIEDSQFIQNEALGTDSVTGKGGGIYVNFLDTKASTLSIVDTTVADNTAILEGGGVWFCTKHGSTFNLKNSIISGNTVGQEAQNYGNATGHGGGLWLGFIPFGGDLDANLANATFSDNTALSQGGGIWIGEVPSAYPAGGGVTANLDHLTITDNKSPDGGGVFSESNSRISTTLTNTIVSGNVVSDVDSTANNIAGAIDEVMSKYNLTGTGITPTGAGNIFNDNPGLGPLANNGGLTLTHRPLSGSPVIDAGDPAFTLPSNFPVVNGVTLTTDQRGDGFSRVYDAIAGGAQIDIGAYEINPAKVIDISISGSTSLHTPYSFAAGMNDSNWVAGDQLKTVPVGGANTVSILFSEEVPNANINVGSMVLKRLSNGFVLQPATGGFSYDMAASTATWIFSTPFVADQHLLSLAETVTDVRGNQLDGEWTNPYSVTTTNSLVSHFPSGDGTAGGDFNFVFTILPGDANLDNEVNGADFLIYLNNNNGGANHTFQQADFDGDGLTNAADLALWQTNFGKDLRDLVFHDFNGDGVIDSLDLGLLLEDWGMSSTVTDLNDDGTVDSLDMGILLNQWGLKLDWLM